MKVKKRGTPVNPNDTRETLSQHRVKIPGPSPNSLWVALKPEPETVVRIALPYGER